MLRLDDPALHGRCDPSGMLQAALAFPLQVQEGWEIGRTTPLPALAGTPAHLVLAGMGGSAIGGDLLAAVLGPRLRIPVAVVRDSSLPPYVNSRSVVVATSYSGETEETLAVAQQAVRTGATLVVVAGGGRLAELGSREGHVIRVPPAVAPRAALGYLMTPVLAAVERWGLTDGAAAEVEEAVRVLGEVVREAGPGVPTPENPAKRLAESLADRFPLVYAGSPAVEPAARRWKCQINENSKMLAAWNVFPELTHNETVGWGAPARVAALTAVVVLLAGDESAQDLRRIAATREVFSGRAGMVHEERGRGTTRLARLLSLVLLGDLTSIYLAYLRGIDPTPVDAIDAVKRRTRETA